MHLLILVISWFALHVAVNAAIVEREIVYTDGDSSYVGTVVYDDAHPLPRPGVMIVHQWTGPGRYEMYRARLLAKEGYIAFVADIYGLDENGTPIRPPSGPEARAVATRFRGGDRVLFRERMQLALNTMRELPETDPERLSAVGYCFGGTGVLELARAGASIQSVISVHGGLDSPAPQDGANIRTSILMLHASHDPTTPPEQIAALIDEFDTHKVDWQLNYYAHHGHSFTDPEQDGYNAVADRRSWNALLSFLAETLADTEESQ